MLTIWRITFQSVILHRRNVASDNPEHACFSNDRYVTSCFRISLIVVNNAIFKGPIAACPARDARYTKKNGENEGP